MTGRLAGSLYVAGWRGVRALPEGLARSAFESGGSLAARRGGGTAKRLERNLRRVLGPQATEQEVAAAVRSGMRSYARYWCEVFRLPAMDETDVVARMHVQDEHRLRDAWAAGRGLILALPHMGNWDHAGAWLVATGVPFTTVAERLRPEALYEQFVRFRESLGMEVIPLTGGQRPPYAELADRLRAGGCLCLLADRDLTRSGVEVDFFGATARMAAGPAALALETGAALLPVTLWYPDGRQWAARIHAQVLPPADGDRRAKVRAMTQAMADAFADGIAAHPEDWHMFQRVWVDDLDVARLPTAAGSVT